MKFHTVGLAEHHRVEWPLTEPGMACALDLLNLHVDRALQDLRGQGLIILYKRIPTIPNWRIHCEKAGFDSVYLHTETRVAA